MGWKPSLVLLALPPSALKDQRTSALGTAKRSSKARCFSPLRLAGGLRELKGLLKPSECVHPRRCPRGDPRVRGKAD